MRQDQMEQGDMIHGKLMERSRRVDG